MADRPVLDEHTEADLQPPCQAVIHHQVAQLLPGGYVMQGMLSLPCPADAAWIAVDLTHDGKFRLVCDFHADAHRRAHADYVICPGCGQRYQCRLDPLNASVPNKPNT